MIQRPEALVALINRGSFHGEDLALAYGAPACGRPGMPDSVAHAERALVEAERRGWIERGKYDPTRQQRFFGVGGHRHLDRLAPEHRSPVCHHWVTRTVKYLTIEDCS